MRYFKKLEGNKVYLSPINTDDFEIYTKWINDLLTGAYLGNASVIYSLPAEKETLEGMAKSGYHFAIILKDEDKLLGNCSFFNIKQIHRTAEVGLFLGEENYRGKGFGSEALELILCYGFKVLNLNNVMLKVYSFNERAIKAYGKIGFHQFGKRTSAYFLNGQYIDEIYMEILSKDFQSKYLDDKIPRYNEQDNELQKTSEKNNSNGEQCL
jgi:RimJ/RimL family protein N-acetyltransferase